MPSMLRSLVITLAFGVSLSVHSNLRAATTSNLSFPDTGWPGDLATSTAYLASSFTTTGSGSYTLGSVTVRMGQAVTPGGGFVLELWSQSSSRPGARIAQLVGETNPQSGTFTYTPATTVTLNANATYWVVATVTSGGTGEFRWLAAANNNQTGDWTIGNNIGFSGNAGANWSIMSFPPSLFSVAATAVPEPSGLMLVLVAGACLCSCRRRPAVLLS